MWYKLAMATLHIQKFGGTSLASAQRLLQSARLVCQSAEFADFAHHLVVVSALTGVTDVLEQIANLAREGHQEQAQQLVSSLQQRHLTCVEELGSEMNDQAQLRSVRVVVSDLFAELQDLVRGVVLVSELTARTRDRILCLGEKISSRLFVMALACQHADACALDADTFLPTDGCFGCAKPLEPEAQASITDVFAPLFARGCIPVVTGFCGRGPHGATTTLGRGGSDLSATYLAGIMKADQVTIWTDVDGVFSADPRIVPEARVITQLNYKEAAELSFYGAEVLHPSSMIPAAVHNIPVLIRNAFAPQNLGTRVDAVISAGSHPVKGISAIAEQSLLSVEGKGMVGMPGVAARVFAALARERISITMISQSSSESTICLAVPSHQVKIAQSSLAHEFSWQLQSGELERIEARHNVSLLAAVGLGMANTPGVASRVFQALARKNINVLAIAQGSSELNISFAIDRNQLDAALIAMHKEFGLHRLDTGEDTAHYLDLLLLGCGNIGSALIELVGDRRASVLERFGFHARVVALADRTGFLFDSKGLDPESLGRALVTKREGLSLDTRPAAVSADPLQMLQHALNYRLTRPILVDVSDAEDSPNLFAQAFELGCDVVTANKKPLAGSWHDYRRITDSAKAHRRLLKAETTVGAGLPVVDTLQMLLDAGDTLIKVEGCLSGTLGFLMSCLQEGQPLSEAVRTAIDLGYTEPDPVADLCGRDVARKAIILGRLSGLVPGETEVALQGLVDESLAGTPVDKLLPLLKKLDASFAQKVRQAASEGKVLRYLARIESQKIHVGPVALDGQSPFGMLLGTDNMIIFTTERYYERPLVVSGPGAGVDVTAMGVMSDILRIAASRRNPRA